MTDYEWTDWITHDNSGWPRGVQPDEVVIARISRDVVGPMPAIDLDWMHHGDPVTAYKRRVWKAPALKAKAEEEA